MRRKEERILTNIVYDNVFASNIESNKVFLYTEETQVTYKNFGYLTNKIANTLVSYNLNPGDRVALKLRSP